MKIKNVIRVRAILFFFLSGVAASAQVPSPRLAANYGKLPLSFEPNQGQTDREVQFVSRGAGFTIFLSPTSAMFALQRDGKTGQSAVVRMDLPGANPDIAIEVQDKLPGTANYLVGTRRPTNVPTYAKTRSRNVYPGIDLVYYGTRGQLEFDFVLAPGADPSRIRMTFAGATPVVDGSGDLVLPLAAKENQSDIRFHKPLLYQLADGVRRTVSGGFTIAANREVGFQAGSYDHSRELVIDPVLVYSSYLGGSQYPSQINAIAVNAAGDIYVAGFTAALDYPTTLGVIEPACQPDDPSGLGAPPGQSKCGPNRNTSAVVSKISADGQFLIYSTYLGGGGAGSQSDSSTGIAVDSGDDAWVVGTTGSNDFPTTSNAYLSYCNPVLNGSGAEISGCLGDSTSSVFLVRLNPAGTTMLYGTFLGLRPLERVFVTKLFAGGFAVEFPVNFDASAIGASVPSLGLAFQHCQGWDPAAPQTTAGE